MYHQLTVNKQEMQLSQFLIKLNFKSCLLGQFLKDGCTRNIERIYFVWPNGSGKQSKATYFLQSFQIITCYIIADQDSPVVSCKAKKKQHAHAAYATTGVLFTATNAVKFASAVTRSS